MTFDHDFEYSFPLFSSLLKTGGRRKGEWISKNLEQKSCLSARSIGKDTTVHSMEPKSLLQCSPVIDNIRLKPGTFHPLMAKYQMNWGPFV